MKFFLRTFNFLTLLPLIFAWNNDELELFDLVEEVNQNFYNLLDIPQDAAAADVRKAFRRLSLVLHPDKNPAPDADVKFRQLVSVYDVIRDASKRQRYDEVLVNGLPDWRSAVYYYRRARKMGLAEMSVLLFVIVSIGQYLVGWAAYLERRFIAEQFLSSKVRKLKKKMNKGKGDSAVLVEEVLAEIPVPSVKDTLPFQFPKLLWWLVTGLPCLVRDHMQERNQRLEEQRLLEEKERAAAAAAAVNEHVERGPRKRKGGGFTAPEIHDDGQSVPTQAQILAKAKREMISASKKPAQSGGLWTDDDIAELVRLVKKYPTGTLERWEKIAEAMERSVAEVTHMAHKVKEDGYRAPAHEHNDLQGTEVEDLTLVGKSRKIKTRGGKLGLEEDTYQGEENSNAKDCDTLETSNSSWNQVQQKALEAALVKYPKGSTQDRWDKISKCVPGKSKEECMLRFRYLAQMVKKKKSKEDSETTEEKEACSESPAASAVAASEERRASGVRIEAATRAPIEEMRTSGARAAERAATEEIRATGVREE